jgi:hypothetical protein
VRRIRRGSANDLSAAQHARTITRNSVGERRGKEGILNPDWQTPILDVALRSGFVLLSEDWGKEIIELSHHRDRKLETGFG